MRAVRVLIGLDHTPPEPVGGYDRWGMELAAQMVRDGHTVTIISRRFSNDVPPEDIIEGVSVRRYQPKSFSKRLWMFGRTISSRGAIPVLRACERDFDVIVGLPYYVVFAGKFAPSLRRVYRAGGTLLGARRWEEFPWPPGMPLHSRLCCYFSWRQLLRREKAAMRRADVIVTPSRNIRDQVAYYYGVPEKSIHVIPHGVNVARFAYHPRPAHDELRIVSVGRLDSVKNHSTLIRAVAIMKHRDKVRMRIVGNGVLRDRLASEIASFGLEESVHLAGHCVEVEKEFQWADVAVQPSVYEAFGIVVLEAMACGVPVVALKSKPPEVWTANEEMIEDGVTGVLLAENSPEVFARALDDLFERRDLCARMGEAGRRRVEREFTWKTVAEQYGELFERLLS